MKISAGQQAILEAKRQRLEELQAMLGAHPRRGEAWTLEIGCGHGHFLTDYAALHSDRFCMGIDLISRRIEKGNRKRDRLGLTNLEFHKVEVGELFAALPEDQRFAEIFMLYPDPWPKKRHFRRRMIQPEFVETVRRRLVAGGCFYFRTDHEGLFEWALEHFGDASRWRVEVGAPWPFERSTIFEEITGRRLDFIAHPVE